TYVFPKSISVVWFAGAGDTCPHSPCPERKIRHHSVQFVDVLVEGAEEVDSTTEDEESASDGIAALDHRIACRRFRSPVYDASGEARSECRIEQWHGVIAGYVLQHAVRK